MSEPIYKVWLTKGTQALYALSQEEQHELIGKVLQTLSAVGAEQVIACDSRWATDKYYNWGVIKFPNIEAVKKQAELLGELDWFRYIDSTSYLGTEVPGS